MPIIDLFIINYVCKSNIQQAENFLANQKSRQIPVICLLLNWNYSFKIKHIRSVVFDACCRSVNSQPV